MKIFGFMLPNSHFNVLFQFKCYSLANQRINKE